MSPESLEKLSSSSAADPEALACLTLLWQAALRLKAEQPLAFDIRLRMPLADYALLCSGRSQAHVHGIAAQMQTSLKEAGKTCQIEGVGNWLLLDCNLVLAHVFHPTTRSYYNLEELMSNSPQLKITDPTEPNPDSPNLEGSFE